MKCSNCGREIAEDSKFCKFCGTNISCTDDNDNSTNKPTIKWGRLMLGVIGVIIGGYAMLRSGGIVSILSFCCIMGIIVFLAYKSKKINSLKP